MKFHIGNVKWWGILIYGWRFLNVICLIFTPKFGEDIYIGLTCSSKFIEKTSLPSEKKYYRQTIEIFSMGNVFLVQKNPTYSKGEETSPMFGTTLSGVVQDVGSYVPAPIAWNYHWVVVSNIFYFHPYLGKIPILANIFQMGWNHQLVFVCITTDTTPIRPNYMERTYI